MTTLYSEHSRSTLFINIPVMAAEITSDKLVFKTDDICMKDALVVHLPPGTEVDDYYDLARNLRGYTLTMVYARSPGYFECVLTNRFDIRTIAVCTPGYNLEVEVDFHQIKDHDASRYRDNGPHRYDYADLFAASITQWPTNRYLRTVVKHPWWGWVIGKDVEGEDNMRLCMRNPDPIDDDEVYITEEITRDMWAKARENYLIVKAVGDDQPRWDSPSNDLYENVGWLGRYGALDLWNCNGRFVAACFDATPGKNIRMFDLSGKLNPTSPNWVTEAIRRLRAFYPQLDHLPL